MDIGKSLKIAMLKSGKENADLAKHFDVHEQAISRWRTTGNMTQARLAEVAKYFEMPVSEFIELGE